MVHTKTQYFRSSEACRFMCTYLHAFQSNLGFKQEEDGTDEEVGTHFAQEIEQGEGDNDTTRSESATHLYEGDEGDGHVDVERNPNIEGNSQYPHQACDPD